MATITESLGAGAFLLSEANGTFSREEVTIATAAGSLKAGTVLGKLTSGGKYVPYDNDATDGSQTAVAILFADCDASGGDKKATVIARNAEVFTERLVWAASVLTGEKAPAYVELAALGIVQR